MSTATQIPALRQSVQSLMACEHGYKLVHIDGLKPPETLQSERGTEVHEVLAKYAVHCAKQKVPADFAYLEALSYNVGDEASMILETCRENISIDYMNFFAAEIHVGLDRNFHPTWAYDHDGKRVEMSDVWAMESSGLPPEESGIMDVVYLYPGGLVVRLPDYKTHPRPFPADTFQGKLYALFAFMHLPSVQEVIFELTFVRYTNIKTTITYLRSDVPRLMDDIKRVRERQLEIHTKVDAVELALHSGAHCTYCPAITDFSCPIAKLNPRMNLDPTDRLRFRLWYDVANRVNNEVMRQSVDSTGESIESVDDNGKAYTFGPAKKEKMTFPLFKLREGETLPQMMADIMQNPERILDHMPIVAALVDHAISDPADLAPKRKGLEPWQLKLRIGSTELSSPLKAKSREVLHNAIKDVANVEGNVELRITRDAEVDDGAGEEWKEYGGSQDF